MSRQPKSSRPGRTGRTGRLGRTGARALIAAGALALAAAGGPAAAQVLPVPQHVVSLSAGASVEVPMDTLTIAFSAVREGADAAGVQSQLKQALDAALTEARRAARPGAVDVRTGSFSLYPRYAAPSPRNPQQPPGIVGWQGSAELIVEGRDSDAIAKLSGRIGTMTIARVNWSLSREAREKVEGEVAAQAIARFRSRADETARQFGYAGWTIRELTVGSGDAADPPRPMFRAQAMTAGGAEALPVEAGRTSVTASVSGSVQLTR